MAFLKSFPTKFGIPATFWMLDAVQDNYRTGNVDIAMGRYASQHAFVAGADPMKRWNITLPASAMRLPTNAIEDMVAATDDFKDAERATVPAPAPAPQEQA